MLTSLITAAVATTAGQAFASGVGMAITAYGIVKTAKKTKIKKG